MAQSDRLPSRTKWSTLLKTERIPTGTYPDLRQSLRRPLRGNRAASGEAPGGFERARRASLAEDESSKRQGAAGTRALGFGRSVGEGGLLNRQSRRSAKVGHLNTSHADRADRYHPQWARRRRRVPAHLNSIRQRATTLLRSAVRSWTAPQEAKCTSFRDGLGMSHNEGGDGGAEPGDGHGHRLQQSIATMRWAKRQKVPDS